MIRLRRFAATARQVLPRFAATARQVLPRFAATARQARVPFLLTTAFVLIAGGADVLACPMCFGAEETSLVDGTRLGILVMLAIVLAVQAAFVGFFLYLRKRATSAAEIELDTEWSQLQRTSR